MNTRLLTLDHYHYPNYDLAAFKRRIWDLKTIDDVENFLMWNQEVLTDNAWNKLMDYIDKNLDGVIYYCEDITELTKSYRKI